MLGEEQGREGGAGDGQLPLLPPGVPRWLPPLTYAFVAIAAAGLLIAHTFWETECPKVDTTSLGLLGLLLIVPLAPYITKLRQGNSRPRLGSLTLKDCDAKPGNCRVRPGEKRPRSNSVTI